MSSTIARSLNSFVATRILGGQSAEARFDKSEVEAIINDNSKKLNRALRKGDEIKSLSDASRQEANDKLDALQAAESVVVRYVPDFSAISETIDLLSSTKLPSFLEDHMVEDTCVEARSIHRRLQMNTVSKSTTNGLKGRFDENLKDIADELGVRGDLHTEAFLWAYEGVTMTAEDPVAKAGIKRRVRTVASSLAASNANTRAELINHVYSVYLSRKREDGAVGESEAKTRNMNPGARSTTFSGRVEAAVNAAAENAINKAGDKVDQKARSLMQDFAAAMKDVLPTLISQVIADQAQGVRNAAADDFVEVTETKQTTVRQSHG